MLCVLTYVSANSASSVCVFVSAFISALLAFAFFVRLVLTNVSAGIAGIICKFSVQALASALAALAVLICFMLTTTRCKADNAGQRKQKCEDNI